MKWCRCRVLFVDGIASDTLASGKVQTCDVAEREGFEPSVEVLAPTAV